MKRIVKLILVIIWLLVIFHFSNQDGSTSTSLTNSILEAYLPFMDSDIFFIIIRKMAHITEYLILGVLVLNSINEFKVDKQIIISILICFILASFDEFHQLFIPGRTGCLFDVFIDISGANLGILILYFIKTHKKQS